MEQLKKALIEEAKEKHKEIAPVGDVRSFDECFTVEKEQLLFWFNPCPNGEHGSTLVLTKALTGVTLET
jgi:hypothetical protein